MSGVIYLLHFERPLAHARHYVGFCESYERLDDRFGRHASGRGSRLLAAVERAGIAWRPVRLWRGTRDDERALKRRREAPRFCPVCSARPRSPALEELVL